MRCDTMGVEKKPLKVVVAAHAPAEELVYL